jgi:hypothetical protein
VWIQSHRRWSGEGCWIPLGETDFGLGYENATSFPASGDFILYPGGYSETEILLAYGGVRFASKMGQLAGNHSMASPKAARTSSRSGKRPRSAVRDDVISRVRNS